MRKFFTIVILALSINGFTQQWTNKAPMPTTRGGASVAVVNNIIYVIGGGNEKSILNTVEAYDPSTNSWTTKAPISIARGEFATAAVNGKIYAIGGYNASLGALNSVEEYNPATNTWTTKASMPTARSLISADVIDNKIYVVGGWPSNLSTLEVYDPSTNTWTTKASSSLGRLQTNGCAVLNNKLFFIGGKNNINTASYQINEAYDIISNTWTTYANLPQARNAGAATVLNNEIHYLGGRVGFSTADFNNHYVYNFSTNTWTDALPMLNKRSNHIAVTVNNRIYVIGGHSEDSSGKRVNWNEEYSPITLCDSILSWGLSLKDSVKLASDVARICGNTATLDAGAGFASYSWNTGATTQSISPIQSGFYEVTVTSSNGCSASDSVYLSLVKAKIIQRDTTICKGASITLNVDSTIIGSTNSSLPPNLQSGLVAYYPFNGNANDESGNGNNGALFGAILSTDRFGNPNKAFSFNGSTNNISIPHKPIFNFESQNAFTLSYWIKPVNLSLTRATVIISKQTGVGFSQKGWNSFIEPNAKTNFYIRNGTAQPYSGCNFGAISDNKWQHVVHSYNKGDAKVFIDGVLAGELLSQQGVLGNTDAPILIGIASWVASNTTGYNGVLDDVSIYNRALTDAEVFQLYKNQSVIWSTGATTNSITVTPTQTTKYYVTVSDGITSCRDSITVSVNDPNEFNPLSDTLRVCGDSVVLDAGAGFATFNWSNGASTQKITAKYGGKYNLSVRNAAGCNSTDSTYVSMVTAKIIQRDTTICKGASITLNVDSAIIGSANSSLPPNLQSGLVAYYPFNGNANDESGNGNNGIIYGAIPATDRFDNTNSAYSFDGVTQYIQSASLSKPITNKTFSAWVKLSTIAQGGGGLAGLQSSTGDIFDVIVYNETNQGWGFGSDNLTRSAWSEVKETASEWIMITATYEQNNYKLYRNGLMIASTTQFDITDFGTTSKINIGYRHTGGTLRYLNSIIDDVYIYDRVLTPQEISLLYKSTSVNWSTGATTNSITVTPNQTTKYYVNVSDGITSCRDSITVSVNDPTKFNPLSDTLRVCGDSVLLDAGSNVSNYLWNTGATTRTIIAKSAGKYTLSVKNAAGCISTDSTYVNLVKADIIQQDTAICKGSSLNIDLNSNSLKNDQWIRVSKQTDIYTRILKTNNGKYLAAARNNSRLYISDSLLNFVPFSSNFVSHNLSMGKDKLGNIYYGTGSQGIYKSIDNGMSWKYNVANGNGCGNLDFETDNQNNLYTSVAGYLRGLFVSKDAGLSWRNTFSGLDFMDIEFLTEYDKVFITSGDDPGGLWYSSSQGSVWTPIKDKPFSLNTIIIKSYAGKIFVFSTTGEVYVSNDGGNNWVLFSKIPIVFKPTKYYNDAIFVDEKNIYVSLDKNGVFHSADNGITWKLLSNGISGDPHYLYYETNTLLATTSNGIYKLNVFNDSTKAIWSTGATTNSITVTPTQTTKYYVTVSDGITSCRDSITVTVHSVDNSLTTLDPTTICANSGSFRLQAGLASSYKWLKDGTVISGATSSLFTATQTGAYRVVVSNANGCTDISRIVNITLTPPSIAGSISGVASVCTGSNSTVLTLTGNTGSIQWQSSANNVNFTNINGANGQTYTATNLTATTFYRAVVTNGVCSAATTASATITVNPASVAGTVSGAATVCSGTNSTVLTLSGNTGGIQWQSSANNVNFTNINCATGQTYTAANLTATTYYRAVVTSGVCAAATTASATITVNPASVAGTVNGAASVCSGTNSTTLTLSGNTGTIQWQSSANNVNFTNINAATAQSYIASNLTTTTYYWAVVTNGSCIAITSSSTITVNPLPILSTSGIVSPLCFSPANQSTTLPYLSSNSPVSYSIDWSAAANQAGLLDQSTTAFVFAAGAGTVTGIVIQGNVAAGTYAGVMSITSSNGCVNTSNISITINALPAVPVISAASNNFCIGSSLVLSTNGSSALQWYRNNVAITNATSSTLTVAQPGDYKVLSTGIGGCVSESLSRLIFENPIPVAGFALNNAVQCFDENRIITTNSSKISGGLMSYVWSFGDSSFSYALNPIHSYKKPGIYKVWLKVSGVGGCMDSVSKDVTINDAPVIPKVNTVGNTVLCEGGNVYLIADDQIKYQWYRNGVAIARDTSKVLKAEIGGIYQVRGSNAQGCFSGLSDALKVIVGAVPGVPEVKDLMYCINALSKPLTAKGSAANALLWYTPLTGDTAKLIAPVPSTSRIGTFDFFVSQRNAEGCEGEKVKLVVRVGSIVKKPEIKWDGGYLSTDAGYESYSWFADNNLVETNTLGIHKPKIGGSYRVKVSNLFGCVDSSAVYILVVTGVSNATVDNTMKMKVYPNPTQSKVWIDIGERPSKEVTLRLIDTKGRVVYQTKTKQQTTMINWSGMVSGTYIVEVVNGTSRRTMKVVKE